MLIRMLFEWNEWQMEVIETLAVVLGFSGSCMPSSRTLLSNCRRREEFEVALANVDVLIQNLKLVAMTYV